MIKLLFIPVFIFALSFSQNAYKFTKELQIQECNNIPELNQKIIKFVDSKMGKKVGRGECWDLAADALKLVGAKWDGNYKFGIKINPKKECVFPGDIIQFEGVKIRYEKEGAVYNETMSHHTAVIYKVLGKGDYVLAHQNTDYSGKKVGISKLNLDNIRRGKYTIFRPTL